jgi:hypothetical protein
MAFLSTPILDHFERDPLNCVFSLQYPAGNSLLIAKKPGTDPFVDSLRPATPIFQWKRLIAQSIQYPGKVIGSGIMSANDNRSFEHCTSPLQQGRQGK